MSTANSWASKLAETQNTINQIITELSITPSMLTQNEKKQFRVNYKNHDQKEGYIMLGIIPLFPHNELVHLPYIAVATNTRTRPEGEEQLLIGIVLERWRLEIALDHLTCYRNNGSQYYRWTISLFCIH